MHIHRRRQLAESSPGIPGYVSNSVFKFPATVARRDRRRALSFHAVFHNSLSISSLLSPFVGFDRSFPVPCRPRLDARTCARLFAPDSFTVSYFTCCHVFRRPGSFVSITCASSLGLVHQFDRQSPAERSFVAHSTSARSTHHRQSPALAEDVLGFLPERQLSTALAR